MPLGGRPGLLVAHSGVVLARVEVLAHVEVLGASGRKNGWLA